MVQLKVEFLELVFVLDGALIQLLLKASLPDSSVGNIIQLGNQKVVNMSVHIILHNVVYSSDLLLERNDVVHELFADLLVFDLDDQALVLIDLLVKLLDHLIDGLSILF